MSKDMEDRTFEDSEHIQAARSHDTNGESMLALHRRAPAAGSKTPMPARDTGILRRCPPYSVSDKGDGQFQPAISSGTVMSKVGRSAFCMSCYEVLGCCLPGDNLNGTNPRITPPEI